MFDRALAGSRVKISRHGQIFILQAARTRMLSEASKTNPDQTLVNWLDNRLNQLERTLSVPLEAETDEQREKTELAKSLGVGLACCKDKRPCRHWHYDSAGSCWRNELTNETRDV